MPKVDRAGERNINNFGSEMVIVDYRKYSDIDVYFPEYNWTFKHTGYNKFKKGNIKCPYEKRYYNTGYLGEGKYKTKENGKNTRVYNTWHNMLQRCYDPKLHKKESTYIECSVNKEWLNLQNFGEWYEENYYEIEGQKMHLDKDILVKHNKVYSPDTCIFVPQTINNLFIKSNKSRGESVIGTTPYKNGKYRTQCNIINPETGKSKKKHLGVYDTEQEAFKVYKYYKERNIKMVADYFKKYIPYELYQGLCNYEVDIND